MGSPPTWYYTGTRRQKRGAILPLAIFAHPASADALAGFSASRGLGDF